MIINQLWKFKKAPNSQTYDHEKCFYIINKLERDKGNSKKMCIDVCKEKKTTDADIIIYHIKKENVKEPKNQIWERKDSDEISPSKINLRI